MLGIAFGSDSLIGIRGANALCYNTENTSRISKMIKKLLQLTTLGAAALISRSAAASPVVVHQFETFNPANTVVDHWYATDVRPGGSASIESAPAGGPLPTGAAVLRTNNTTAAKAEVSTFADYGLASTALSSINLSYSYYKTTTSENFAAPSLKLNILDTVTGHVGQLVYEVNWNLGAGSQPPLQNSWQSISINPTTGAGDDSTGGWWWNGGAFNTASGAGGPPLQSLDEWINTFNGNSLDFATAKLIGLSVGIGTYNADQIGDYFDAVQIQLFGLDKTYDFEPQGVPDSGTTLTMLVVALIGMAGFGLRKRLAKI